MKRIFLIGLCAASTALFAQDKKKWDVNNPPNSNYKNVSFTVTEGTWMSLDVSPDGQTIVFDMLGDIYAMPLTGGNAKPLRTGIAYEVQPRFSPDGKKLLFTSDAGGGDNIWTMNADGSNAKQITKETFRLLNNAAWTPDMHTSLQENTSHLHVLQVPAKFGCIMLVVETVYNSPQEKMINRM